MDVPKLNRQVGLQTGGFTPRVEPITETSSGLNVTRAQGEAFKTLGAVGEQIAAHVIAKQKLEREQAVNDVANEFNKELNEKHLYGEGGALMRQGANAKDSTVKFYTDAETLRQKYASQIQDKEEARLFHGLSSKLVSSYGEAVTRHEASENSKALVDGLASSVKMYSSAISSNPGTKGSDELFNVSLERTEDVSKHLGKSQAGIDMDKKEMAGVIALEVINANIDKDPVAAKTFLNSKKDLMLPETYQKLDDKISGNVFAKEVYTAKLAGMDKGEILKTYADDLKYNRGDAARKAELYVAVNKAFAVTDPKVYNFLADGIEDGKIRKQSDLDQYFDRGQLEEGEFKSLSERLRSSNAGEEGGKLSPEMKIALADVRLKVNNKYSNTEKRAEAMFVFNQKARAYPNADIFLAEATKSLEKKVVSLDMFHDNREHGWEDELDEMRYDSAERAEKINRAVNVLNRTGKLVSPENVVGLMNYWEKNPNDKRFQ